MRIVKSTMDENAELPLQLFVSFEKVFSLFEKYASKEYKEHPYHKSAKDMVEEFRKYPELIEGFSDLSLLEKYQEQIDFLMEPLFPEPLLLNEIKAASIPFSFTSFKFTDRFENIIDNAGDDFELNVRNFEDDMMYIMSCTYILSYKYGYNIDLKRPFFFDIPDKQAGITRHYRAAFNGDFTDVIATENAPEITEEDYKELLDNFDNIDVWKEKFPPNSYILKGFGLMNLFDVTADETIASIRTNLLKSGDNLVEELQHNLREFFNIKDLMLGFSLFCIEEDQDLSQIKMSQSLVFSEANDFACSDFFCSHITDQVFKQNETIAISDVEKYGKATHGNSFYKALNKRDIGSIILIPIKASDDETLAVLEIASPRPYELNSINQNKLKDILPAFEAAVDRASEEQKNIIEATIQEHYTSLHESVKWRFIDAAEKYQNELQSGVEDAKPDQIVFEDVFPLYGQADIKGSSTARNEAIKEDLTTQLSLAITVLDKACNTEKLPIYDELKFRVEEYLSNVKEGLNAGDEIGILDFLKRDIYPVFKHIRDLGKGLSKEVDIYMSRLDENLHVVYEKRKAYEDSVSMLNDKLAKFIDKKQVEAQEMFPHYFERYKTDGVEHDMYIGQSLVKNKKFDPIYLFNLRLWQLQLMCEMENVANSMRQCMPHDLRVASLILVHSNSLAIKFRMDEKQFDVDGAYNIRYEIIKKRIDKAHIKGTDERLTVPDKISIVYSQDKDAKEYIKYIKYLQSKNFLGKVETLELEDLQGVSGLKALRAEVIYQKDFDEKNTITFQDLIEEIKS
ncbi:GAF domain-containing protein [Pseudotenacibaculum sp. MALMAid0570]|uniref:GAF domain-containing protein n=1 Tax=Pseudotenacibaculum sp. MALMAid0570 TaxID=3143938 RepID=UPI0032DF207C